MADSERRVRLGAANAQAWFNHGFLLESLGQNESALAAFARATDLCPHLDRAWYGQGLVLMRLERHEEALRALRRTTELQPMSPHAWYQLARLHFIQQDLDEAAKVIRHLKGFEPQVSAQLERETGFFACR